MLIFSEKKGFGNFFGKHTRKKEVFWSFLVRAKLNSWKWYGRCEEEKSVLYTFRHDIRSCAIEGQLKS